MKKTSMIQKFFRKEKTTRIFILMILVSLGICVFSGIFKAEGFKEFGWWGFVWGWLLFSLTYTGPLLYRRIVGLNGKDPKDPVERLGWGLSAYGLSISFLYLLWLFGGPRSAATEKVVLTFGEIALVLMGLGGTLRGIVWVRTKTRQWLQSPNDNPSQSREENSDNH